jgi:type IV secretion system protein VirB10
MWALLSVAILFGLVVFWWLSGHRNVAAAKDLPPSASDAVLPPAPAAPPELVAMEQAGRGVGSAPTSGPPAAPPVPPPTPAPDAAPPPVDPSAAASGKAPALIVDLAQPTSSVLVNPGPAAAGGPAGGARPAGAALNDNESFAARVGAEQPDRAQAVMLHGKSALAPQGAIIPAVLETALDSDLPGMARAIVSRDVRSFDGSAVLISRGSRLIGEYRSAAAQGQSRAFVIWTRIIRPDGASIQIGSPGGDSLGRAGLAGSVDRHFLERFGGAILLSVVNAGAAALAGGPATEVVIGSSQQATGLASAASSAYAPANIPPTIKVPQGTPIRVFVARDLDFSGAPVPAA